MTFLQKFKDIFVRGDKKKTKLKGHVYGRRTLVAAPVTAGMVCVQLPPGGLEPDMPQAPPKARVRQRNLSAATSCRSLTAYGQEGLAAIGMVPRPAWESSSSLDKLDEKEMQIKKHLRYALLNKKDINAPVTTVGPNRLRALEGYEDSMEGAEKEATQSLDVKTKGTESETGPSSVAVQSAVKDEESLARIEGKPLLNRVARAFKIDKVTKSVGTGRRGVGQKAKPLPKPAEDPLSLGPRRWFREGVDPAADPRTSSPRLFGRDHKGPKRTVFPREWDTMLVATVGRPRAVPAKYYKEFARETQYIFPGGFKDTAAVSPLIW
ncbi:uncharacterized protein DFL_007778 [Arthrobotrys flagrans]|uniref:Uncharacterized protein n=1 Tax=Arthrobotrys flagrans TaxID=97331 RepID=A0A436ZWM1_ARTFL|nr:hypothetical protein DFL_007778 [Arthrobotrys flagrans]